MAGGAHAIRIPVISRERGVLRVVECRIQPTRRVVTRLASRGKELGLCRMAGIRGVVVVGLMATHARRRQGRVVVVDVAIRANSRRDSMHAGQREGCVVVVENAVGPNHRVMADFARGRESGGDVIHGR